MKAIPLLIGLMIGCVAALGQVAPSFQPAQAPGTAAKLMLQSETEAQNSMTHAAQRQQIQANAELLQQQTAIMQTMLPAIQAKAKADAAMAQTQLDNEKALQNFRRTADQDAPEALDQFLSIMGQNPTDDGARNIALSADGTPDYETRNRMLASLQAKYSYLSLLPEYQDLIAKIEAAREIAFDKMTNDRFRATNPLGDSPAVSANPLGDRPAGTGNPLGDNPAPAAVRPNPIGDHPVVGDTYAAFARPVPAKPSDSYASISTPALSVSTEVHPMQRPLSHPVPNLSNPVPNLSKALVVTGSGHWIQSNADGEIITLEDGSIWQVDDVDVADTTLWLVATEITIVESNDGMPGYDYLLVNTDDSEKAHAKCIGRR